MINFAAAETRPELPGELRGPATVVLSTDPGRTGEGDGADLGGLRLGPGEGLLLRLA